MNILVPCPRRASRLAFLTLTMAFSATIVMANPLTTGWEDVAGVDIFYREGGDPAAPTIVFLHGNPASSLQYVGVMESLMEKFHVLAMDYPSFGFSAAPDAAHYQYTFDRVAETVRDFLRIRGTTRYALFMQDYGVPIGFRLIAESPDQVTAIVIQNGVIHLDGFPTAQNANGELRRHWKSRNPGIDARRVSYTAGVGYPQRKSWQWPAGVPPEFELANLASARRPGVMSARNDLWFDYGTNLERYPSWQALVQRHSAPLLVIWGGRDSFFTTPGAFAYLRQRPEAQIHILDADHYATVEVPDQIAGITAQFLMRQRPTR